MNPQTSTGRKVIAIHGDVLLDDVLGIEAEVEKPYRELLGMASLSLLELVNTGWSGLSEREALRVRDQIERCLGAAALDEAAEADVSERPCSTCGATETVEISDERQTIRVCAECGSDEP